MKKNLRDKIHTFLQSENGKVGIKSPLTLSIVSSSLLLAQMILTPHADAGFECWSHADCNQAEGERCHFFLKDAGGGTLVWHSTCG